MVDPGLACAASLDESRPMMVGTLHLDGLVRYQRMKSREGSDLLVER